MVRDLLGLVLGFSMAQARQCRELESMWQLEGSTGFQRYELDYFPLYYILGKFIPFVTFLDITDGEQGLYVCLSRNPFEDGVGPKGRR